MSVNQWRAVNTWVVLSDEGIPVSSRKPIGALNTYLKVLGYTDNLNDNLFEWLMSKNLPFKEDNYNDLLNDYLESLGYTGSLNDKLNSWYNSP